jgi:DNA-binding XRE family transcriptional regulator
MPTSGFIYAIGAEGSPHVKIGKTTVPVAKRLVALQTGQPVPLKVLAYVPVDHGLSRIEKAIHRFLQADRQHGEWFALQVDQDQLEALIVRAVQWLAEEDASKAATTKARRAEQRKTALRRDTGFLARRLQLLRRSKGFSRRQLAIYATLPQETISRLERGEQDYPSVPVTTRLARVLGTSPGYLLGLEPAEQRGRRKRDDLGFFVPTLPGMAVGTV